MLNLLLAASLTYTTADAAPKRDQVHLQVQTGMLSREALRVEETDHEHREIQLGPGAGGVSMGLGYQLRAHSEVGGRVEMSRASVHTGISDVQYGHARVAGTYTHYIPVAAPVHFAATGMLGLERSSFDGAAIARGPFVGASGNLHWFVASRVSLHAGVEATRSLGGRFEQTGLEGSSRFVATDIAAVAGMNFFVGTKNRSSKARRR
jgi:hypothetical protein